jgi:hypothetical protein
MASLARQERLSATALSCASAEDDMYITKAIGSELPKGSASADDDDAAFRAELQKAAQQPCPPASPSLHVPARTNGRQQLWTVATMFPCRARFLQPR